VKEAKEHNAAGKRRDEKTMSGKTRYVGYLNGEFGKSLMSAIKRADALLFLRKIEQTGKLETRDRTRATGEAIFAYANLDDLGGNPFRKFDKHQLLKNVSTPRPALINERSGAVARLFQTIAAPYGRARFGDLVGHALRFISLTVIRPVRSPARSGPISIPTTGSGRLQIKTDVIDMRQGVLASWDAVKQNYPDDHQVIWRDIPIGRILRQPGIPMAGPDGTGVSRSPAALNPPTTGATAAI
jgi:hypothetical protein